jgi:tRNA pseudouridine55 synthase
MKDELHPSGGVLNIDKPAGLTSHDVVNRIRRLAGLRRVGHAGTLDPLATGVLLVCLGRATRLVEYLTGQPKTYLATIRLGQTTNTYDAEGEITAEKPVMATEQEIETALAAFRDTISQLPPMFSAVKQGGRPLYKLARQGEEVERAARQVTIYELELLDWQPPDLQLRVVCSAGTYIRSLAHDLGRTLGCGGHITELRRTAIGSFTIETAVPLDNLTSDNLATHLLPAEAAVQQFPRLDVTAEEALSLQQGKQIGRQSSQPNAPLVRAYDENGRFLGILTSIENGWQPHKIFS